MKNIPVAPPELVRCESSAHCDHEPMLSFHRPVSAQEKALDAILKIEGNIKDKKHYYLYLYVTRISASAFPAPHVDLHEIRDPVISIIHRHVSGRVAAGIGLNNHHVTCLRSITGGGIHVASLRIRTLSDTNKPRIHERRAIVFGLLNIIIVIGSLYIKQKSKCNMYVTSDEREYCRRYEQQELAKLEPCERNAARRIKSTPPEHRQLTYEPKMMN